MDSHKLPDPIERVARAICKSKTCHGKDCREWPANAGLRHKCRVDKGGFDDAARAAIAAMREPTDRSNRKKGAPLRLCLSRARSIAASWPVRSAKPPVLLTGAWTRHTRDMTI